MSEIRDEKTGQFLPGHPSVGHRFLPGNSGLPGRPKGARNKLSEAFIDDLYHDWLEHGIQAIRDVRESRPSDYLKICAILVRSSSEFNSISETIHSDAIAELIEERRKLAQSMIAKMKSQ
jgi:hypothetical protein